MSQQKCNRTPYSVVLGILIIPFSYFSIIGVRALWLLCLPIGLCLLRGKFFFLEGRALSGLIFSLFLIVCSAFCLTSGSFQILLAACLFFFLAYELFEGVRDTAIFVDAIELYRISVIFVVISLLGQYIFIELTGVPILEYEIFGSRRAFGFLWNDYSFLSLYMAGSVPLFLEYERGMYKHGALLAVITGACLTSARTGLFALIVFYGVRLLYLGISCLRKDKNHKNLLLSPLLVIFLSLVYLKYGINYFTNRREESLSLDSGFVTLGSGRIEGFLQAIQFLQDSLLWGAKMDKNSYVEMFGGVPHNIFLYIYVLGGSVLFLIFLLWISFLWLELESAEKSLKYSIVISFIGFQFLPSIFSAYFLAVLIGLALTSCRLKDPMTS